MSTLSVASVRNDPVIARAAPFLMFIAMVMLASALAKSPSLSVTIAGASAYEWVVLTRACLIALALIWFWPSYGDLRNTRRPRTGHLILAIVGGAAVFILWIYFDHNWAVLSRGAGFKPVLPDGTVHWPKALFRLVGFGLVVPIMEELFWRSLILRWIERRDFLAVEPRRIGIKAFLITTALFAVEHDRWFAGAIAGSFYNWVYMRSGNLWMAILAHAVTNTALGLWVWCTGNWQFW